MTNEEIKKGLEICCDDNYNYRCCGCPYNSVRHCNNALGNDARELIIKQEQEIERLKAQQRKIVFIDVSESDKERIIPEGEPIKDIGAEGALGKEGKTSCDEGEYKNRFEIADKVLTETRAKLAKAEHDRDRYKAEIKRLKRIVEQKVKQVEVEE